MKELKVRDVMVSPVASIHIEKPVSQGEELMRTMRIRHVPVVDDRHHLVGLLSQNDLLRHVSPHITEDGFRFDKTQLDSCILRHIMTSDPVCLNPEDPFLKAVEIMAREKYGCIPVVEKDRRLVGILTPIDVLRILHKALSGA